MAERIMLLLMTIATGFVTFLAIQAISTGDANWLLILVPLIMLLVILHLIGGDNDA